MVTRMADSHRRSAPAGQRRPAFRRLSTDRRREDIITAAIGLFGHRPEPEVSIDDIAAAAGTSRSSLYRYFANRQELYLVAMRRLGAELNRRLETPVPGPPSAQLAARIRGYFDFLEEYGTAYAGLLLSGSHTLAEQRAIAQEVRERIYRLAYRTLEVNEPTRTLETMVRSWVAAVEWTAMEWLFTRRPARGELEGLMAAHFGVMLVAAGANDPVVAGRIEWLLEVEPPDGPLAERLRAIFDVFPLRLLSTASRFLTGEPGNASG